jgi:hypothetical protein
LLNIDYFINNTQINKEYTLITNSNKNNYNDDKAKDIYHKRWHVEVFLNKQITTVDQNNIYNIHNIKLLIVCLFSK